MVGFDTRLTANSPTCMNSASVASRRFSPMAPSRTTPSASLTTLRSALDIGGRYRDSSRKFRNIITNGEVAFVVDDIASLDPWHVRCLEIRGHGEVLTDPTDSASRFPGAIIRIHARRIISFGIDPEHLTLGKRDVAPALT